MGSIYKQAYKSADGKLRRTKHYYIEYKDSSGRVTKLPCWGLTHKECRLKLATLEADRTSHGQTNHCQRVVPLVSAYVAVLAARGCCRRYVDQVRSRLTKILTTDSGSAADGGSVSG